MPLAIPKILVVADPGEQRELVALLRGAGAPFTEAVIAVDDGDDGTLAQFVELRPAVVVVAASLTAGDTRSLVAAMRDAAPGGVFIVLLGDERGPVRNALDAIDFGCDRFVARPLAVKALRFAVMSGLGAAAGAPGRTEPGNGRAAMIGPRGTEPMAAVRVAEPMAAVGRSEPVPVAARITEPMAAVWGAEPPAARTTRPMTAVEAAVEIAAPVEVDAAVTAPVRARTTTISAQRARWEALADAIGTGDGLGDDGDDDAAADAADDDDAPLITSRVPTGEIEVGIEHTIHAEPPPRHHAAAGPDLAEDIVLREALFDDLSGDGPARPLDRAAAPPLARHEDEVEPLAAESPTPIPPAGPWRPGSTEVPDVPVREPTLVLGEVSPPPPLAPPAPVELIERHAEGPEGGGWSSASQVSPAPDDDDDVLADVAAGVDDDLSIDLAPEERGPGAPLPVVAEPPPSGGDFARELRRKMSAMAERLFRGGDLPASPVAIGPGHDHHTEIDLGGLVDDPSLLGGGEAFDLAGGATFVGSEDHVTSTQGTEARGTAEAGEIQRGVSDAAALIARMFAADFTGRIVFRRGPVEKVIHVESGRPVFASSSLAHDRMGELLLREGKITAEQYARCRDLVRDTGRRMGEILVERGFLKRRELLPAVRRHVEDIIYSLFAWDHGEYRIVAGDGAASERIRLSRHPAAMVLEGVRRKLDRPSLERLLGPTSTIVETTDRDKVAAITGVADLSAEERAALAAFDGAADLAQVARQSGAGLANVYQLAWSLHLLGLATTRRRAGEDEGDAPALVGESDLAIDRDRVRARHALVLDADYFALLGVRRDATGFEIKRAYEAARRDFAADTFPSELRRELSAELDDIAEVLDEAYRVLHDDALRAAYVRHLRDFGSSTS